MPLRCTIGPLLALLMLSSGSWAQEKEKSLDERVQNFLASRTYSWRDMNIPERDGQFLYDMIIQKEYTRALEIGTSTGHSAIWIAWALSKTGGKLITIEIDQDRYTEAVENFQKAGVAPWIDARLADAHDLVKELEGPFDFVFSDADKDWYTQYFKDVAPKIVAGGTFVAHNATMRSRGIRDFLDHLDQRKDFDSYVETDVTSGVSVSVRKE